LSQLRSGQECVPLSAQLASAQDASAHEAVAQEASAHDASAQLASLHDAAAHEALSQAASPRAASAQLAASKTGVELPSGSGTRNLSSGRFGLGGAVTSAAASSLTSPTPALPGGVDGSAFALDIRAPFT